MKIFIIYASAGFGHKKIAEAIKETAVSLYGKDHVYFLDVLDFTSELFKFLYSKGYTFLITRLSWLWAFLFYLADTRIFKLFNDNLRRYINKILCRRFLAFIEREQPDVIISTHFLVNELVSQLKEKEGLKTRLISVVTDFGVHSFWLAKNIDIYVAASEQTKKILISKGVGSDKIKVLGLPYREQFKRELDRQLCREKLGISNDRFTALIMTGGIGVGPISKIVQLLSKDINMIVICGNNKKLYAQLKKLQIKSLVILGWINCVEEIMSAADIIITKPGGSTIAECLVKDLPMVFFSIIPGQEYQNAVIMEEVGIGFIINNVQSIKEKALFLRDNPKELKSIKDKIDLFRKEDPANKIIRLINE